MDPYSQDMQTPTVMEQVGSFLNPIELAKYKYTMDPTVWGGSWLGTSKGVWMPVKFQDINLGKYSRGVKKAFAQGKWAGVKAIGSPLKSAWDSNNYIGGGWLRQSSQINRFTSELDNTLFSYFDDMTKRKRMPLSRDWAGIGQMMKGRKYNYTTTRRYSASKADQLAKAFRMDVVDWMDEAGSINRLSAVKLQERLKARVSNRQFIGEYGDLRGKIDDIMSQVGVSKKATGRGVRRTAEFAARAKNAGVAGAIGKIGSGASKLAGPARLGMFAMKGFAAIGLVSTMWDITQMIGQPIGNLLVNEANRVMNNFHARFMPELGGRLAMSYMTTGAATERQRAVSAISKAYINGRSAFGQEAVYSHS